MTYSNFMPILFLLSKFKKPKILGATTKSLDFLTKILRCLL